MQLHIISHSPYKNTIFTQALATATANDKLLLVDEGVYALTGVYKQQIQAHPTACFAIKEHLALRGLPLDEDAAELIDFDTFVRLSLDAQHCLSWY